MERKKIASSLKTFCKENRNVHQSIKAWETELFECCGELDPRLHRLRRSIVSMDRELSDVSMSIKLKEFIESLKLSVSLVG